MDKKKSPKYTADFRERGVRLFREQRPEYDSDNAAHKAIASSSYANQQIHYIFKALRLMIGSYGLPRASFCGSS